MADKAVLCGINNYESISDLSGCINDVENIKELLTKDFGFDGDNVKTYFDKNVTKKGIVNAFKWLADGAEQSDRLIFHFSGHGSYIKSENDDEERDELICLYSMDWANPDSYLIDDDLGELTKLVKSGRLTVILDSCHSGSGTRAITANFGFARSASPKSRLIVLSDTAAQISSSRSEETLRRLTDGNSALMRSFRDERKHPVFARFVEPPAAYRPKPDTHRVKRLGASLQVELNHQLLAGASDAQTAADAFIDGDYNGAFSYYLCDTARQIGKRSYNNVMDNTISTLELNGYSQVPQNEGPFGNEALFGGVALGEEEKTETLSQLEPDLNFEQCGSESSENSSTASQEDVRPLSLLSDLLRVSEKLIDLSSVPERESATVVSGRRGSGDEVIVYVHGISKHQAGYSVSWYNAIRRYLARNIVRGEVLWSQLVNSRSDVPGETRAIKDFTKEIEQELARRRDVIEKQLSVDGRQARMESPRGSGFSVDDFAKYMLVQSTRNAILTQFDNIVRPLLASGKKVHVVSHSWGTVVAYEGLRRMDSTPFPGRVANLFVVGSALSISPVRSNLFGRVRDGRKPRTVDRIINMDAGGDLVGGAIGEHFTVDREFLGLDPVGCSKIFFTNIALNPACAHSSYFKSANTEASRDIFAHFVNNS